MNVTLFCDAAICHTMNVVGWGAWVKSSRMGKGQLLSGILKEPTNKSGLAEARSACNALYEALRLGYIQPHDEVMIQLDSLEALGLFDLPSKIKKLKEKRKEIQEVQAMIHKIATKNHIVFKRKHVKGHSASDGSRHSVNIECDRLAKEKMNAGRSNPPWAVKTNTVPRLHDQAGKDDDQPVLQRGEGRGPSQQFPEPSTREEVGANPGADNPESLSPSERRRREIAQPVGMPDPASLGRVGRGTRC